MREQPEVPHRLRLRRHRLGTGAGTGGRPVPARRASSIERVERVRVARLSPPLRPRRLEELVDDRIERGPELRARIGNTASDQVPRAFTVGVLRAGTGPSRIRACAASRSMPARARRHSLRSTPSGTFRADANSAASALRRDRRRRRDRLDLRARQLPVAQRRRGRGQLCDLLRRLDQAPRAPDRRTRPTRQLIRGRTETPRAATCTHPQPAAPTTSSPTPRAVRPDRTPSTNRQPRRPEPRPDRAPRAARATALRPHSTSLACDARTSWRERCGHALNLRRG